MTYFDPVERTTTCVMMTASPGGARMLLAGRPAVAIHLCTTTPPDSGPLKNLINPTTCVRNKLISPYLKWVRGSRHNCACLWFLDASRRHSCDCGRRWLAVIRTEDGIKPALLIQKPGGGGTPCPTPQNIHCHAPGGLRGETEYVGVLVARGRDWPHILSIHF